MKLTQMLLLLELLLLLLLVYRSHGSGTSAAAEPVFEAAAPEAVAYVT